METARHLSPLETIVSRHRILEQIDNGIQDKRDINENIDTSRTTIDRAVRELEEENVLHRRGGDCEFTRFGKLAYQEFCEASQTFETLSNANELLAILPDESTLDIALLEGADVKLADQRAPVAPFRQFTPVPSSRRVQAMLPVIFPQQLQFLCQRATEGNEVELLIHEDLTTILEEDYADELQTLKEHSVRICSSTDLPQFGLTIIDSEKIWVSVHRQSGGLHGLLENSTTEAVDQAQLLFERYLNESQKYGALRA